MRDAVLHEDNQISLLGWKNVNPGLISAMTVSAVLLIAAACIRIFVIPRFQNGSRQVSDAAGTGGQYV